MTVCYCSGERILITSRFHECDADTDRLLTESRERVFRADAMAANVRYMRSAGIPERAQFYELKAFRSYVSQPGRVGGFGGLS